MTADSRFRAPTVIAGARVTRAYILLGLILCFLAFHDLVVWDIGRGAIVVFATANALLSAHIALLYTNSVFPKVPVRLRFFGTSPTSYWLGALGMLLLGFGLVLGSFARAGEHPASPPSLFLVAGGLAVLTTWSAITLRGLYRLSEGLDE